MHATIGGSVAARIIACPGSVPLSKQMPPRKVGRDADEGSLLHEAMALVLDGKLTPEQTVGLEFNGITLDHDMMVERLTPALAMFDELGDVEYLTEQRVTYASLIPDAYGTADIIGRRGRTAVVADHKFGAGIAVTARENFQLAFYADAARLTPATQWAFKDIDDIEFAIIQPAHGLSRWSTTPQYLDDFRKKLLVAVNLTEAEEPPLQAGTHCRWCAAKPICPLLSGAADRALSTGLANVGDVGPLLDQAELLEAWIKSVRELAQTALETGRPVTGFKLVPKRAIRRWTDEAAAASTLAAAGINPYTEIVTPAAAEKLLKVQKLTLPPELVVAVSSGNTVARESDPRPAINSLPLRRKIMLTQHQ